MGSCANNAYHRVARLEIPIRPIATQSVRTTRSGHKYQPARVVKFKHDVGKAALLQLGKHWKPLEGEVIMELELDFKLPKTAKKSLHKIVASGEKLPMLQRPDADNCGKGIFDALNGIVYLDDCQIRRQAITKNIADTDGIYITVYVPAGD